MGCLPGVLDVGVVARSVPQRHESQGPKMSKEKKHDENDTVRNIVSSHKVVEDYLEFLSLSKHKSKNLTIFSQQ